MRICIIFLFSLVFITIFAYAAETADLFKVAIENQSDADILSGIGPDVLLRVEDGYLILISSQESDMLTASGLTCERVTADIDRSCIALDIRHDRSRVIPNPVVYEDDRIRLYRIDAVELSEIYRGVELAPIPRMKIPIIFDDTRPSIKKSAIPKNELDALLNNILQDSLESYSYYLQSYDGRASGTSGNLTSGIWLAEKFNEFGYDSVVVSTFTADIYGHPTTGRNILAYKVGTECPLHHLIIGAHRDTEEGSPGADDNGSGTAAVLEMARAFSGVDTKVTIIFALFDVEEHGLLGSWHYVNEAYANNERIIFMLNLDMIAHFENDYDAKVYSESNNDPYAQLWANLADSIPGININGHLPGWFGSSDHYPFWQLGYDAIFVHEYILSTVLHDPNDSTTYMNFDYMTRMVKTSLATIYTVDQSFEPDYEFSIMPYGALPELVYPDTPAPVELMVYAIGGAQLVPGSVYLHYAVNDGDYTALGMTDMGGGKYMEMLPAVACMDKIIYYLSAEDDSLGMFYYPAPEFPVTAYAATGLDTVFHDNFADDKGWSVSGDASSGQWERVEVNGGGMWGAPDDDFDGNHYCYLTGEWLGFDVDGGTTTLISPSIDASVPNVLVQYVRWFSNDIMGPPYTDTLVTYISNDDGATWNHLETVGPIEQATGGWNQIQFMLHDFIEPTNSIRMRFDASDLYGDSHVEAAVDAFIWVTLSTGPAITTEAVPNWTAGFPYWYQLEAISCEEDYTWTDKHNHLEGVGLNLSPDGLLTGIPAITGSFVFIARATDLHGGGDERPFNFVINPELNMTTQQIPDAFVGQYYECQLNSIGGTGNKTWSISEGDLTGTGLILSEGGLISGIPADIGEVVFTARVTDAVGAFDEGSLILYLTIPFTCGDANHDDQVNVGDAVYIINYIFKSGPPPVPPQAGDANGDDGVDVADAVYLINFIFKGGPSPAC